MKTKEELDALKEEVETLNKKLAELTEEEMKLVFGGAIPSFTESDIKKTGVDFSAPNYLNIVE